jgi:hypothetical protein
MVKYPTIKAKKEMMRSAKGISSKNSFFISKITGDIIISAWRDNKSYFADIPKDTYEIHIRKNYFLSYSDLNEQIENTISLILQDEEMQKEYEQNKDKFKDGY